MTIVNVNGLCKSYVTHTVLDGVSFKIEHGDKIGVIGVNGAGKTTLFRILCRLEEHDDGSVIYDKDLKIAYMKQHSDYTSDKNAKEELEELFADCITVEKLLAEANAAVENDPSEENIRKQAKLNETFVDLDGLTFRSRIRSTLMGLGFDDREMEIPMSALSGGQRTRVLLAKVLLSGVGLLLLDEPTNHLDISSTLWLEDFLASYKGAAVIVSHDRYFLDRLCNRIFEIENTHLTDYYGNYTEYRAQRAINDLTLERDYEKKTKEIKRIEGIIAQQKRFNQERNYVTIKSKQKQIDRIKAELVKPEATPDSIGFSFKACHGTGNDVLTLESVGKSYAQKTVAKNLDAYIKMQDRVFLTGSNGCGKTTLLRMITGRETLDSGTVKIGARVEIGYYDQTLSEINPNKTVFDDLADAYPRMSNLEIRKALALFLFKGEDVFKVCGTLSGGEKARVCLAKLMLSHVNFLILDEPTNHLDIQSKEALEDALADYDGTLLIVSHDRYFINRLATKLWYMDEGKITEYKGNFDEYLMSKADKQLAIKTEKADRSGEYQRKKAAESEFKKKKNRFAAVEKEIMRIEEEISSLEASLESPDIGGDYKKIMEISEGISENKEKLNSLYEEYELLAEDIERGL